ncbi:hypothetical protein F0562_015859 [Nyssa sinensis]|uniref:Bromo domain-containing protein n=1 Tax=Nyssa sinensis TaxID=561372 RepID=A0A5J4ZKY1_9ASTE|nr:hypothetical protein F0562_015859 [Nyssa sinensis]
MCSLSGALKASRAGERERERERECPNLRTEKAMEELQRTNQTLPFMTKPDDTPEREKETSWGTWEELLLACAVNRHGTKSWDSVAIEIQKRSSTSTLQHLLTPQNCKHKYHDLKRRYTNKENQNDVVSKPDDSDDVKTEIIPWLDELRKLRVAELKRELERYDLSIVSLQSKVKRLKEERDQSLRDSENGGTKSDLEKSVERERDEEEKANGDGEPEKASPKLVAGKSLSGEESDRENQSVNESNSTDPKSDNIETGREEVKTEPEPIEIGEEKPEVQTKPAREDSCNGSSDSIAKEPVRESVKVEPEGGESDSPELLESVAESKGGNEGAKESSDVQSSASLSRQKGRDKVGAGACSSGEEPENEDQSPAIKEVSVKSQPFIDFLETIRSHKLGSIFDRRLESQETPKYRSLIRQHIDLETIRVRTDEGWYLGCNSKFFRDLLLLINNAMVFFGKKSSESAAAIELQQLVLKEMAQRNPKSDLSADDRTSLPPVPLPPKPDPEPSDFLLLKPKISGPMIVCRKRSSIVAKASASSSGVDRKREQAASSSGVDRKREQAASLVEEKPMLDWKQPEKSSVKAEENRITKKRSRERFASSSKSLKKNGKNRTNTTPNKNPEAISSQNQGKGGSPSEHSEPKSEKKKSTSMASVVKRSATNSSNGTKRSSSSNNGPLLDTLKSSTITSKNDRAEQKKSSNGKGEGRKDPVSRRSSGGRQAKEQGSPAKRNVGRPPKRAAAPPPPSIQPAVTGKRSREGGETEAVASRQPKKRSRK